MGSMRLGDGTVLHYECVGAGPPVIVCHGGPSTTYQYLVDDLAPLSDVVTLVFHDYRGSGRSASAAPDSYRFEQLADDVAALAAHLGHSSFDLLAHSMGGVVALEGGLRHPAAVRRLVLIDVAPSGRLARMALPTIRALGARRLFTVVGRGARYLSWWSWRKETPERTLARYSIMGAMQEGAPEHRAAIRQREVLADNENAPHLERRSGSFDVVDELATIEAPVLVVYGSLDAPFAVGSRMLVDRLPNVLELRVDGSGHHPLVEQPDVVLPVIREFLTRR
jgi:proline iminopeptidase